MSDTPRTEAEVNRQKCWSDDLVTIDANFAAQLERELNAAHERIKRLEEFINRFFDPEDLGYVVSTVVRDDAREALGMKRVESGSRVSMI